MLEWAWLLAAHGHVMYRYAAHDADLYRAAFALAGKGDSFRQLPLVPRVALGAYDRHQQGSEVPTAVMNICANPSSKPDKVQPHGR